MLVLHHADSGLVLASKVGKRRLKGLDFGSDYDPKFMHEELVETQLKITLLLIFIWATDDPECAAFGVTHQTNKRTQGTYVLFV